MLTADRTFFRLLRLAWPFRWWMLLSALLGFATIGSSIGLMSTSAWIIATAALHPSIAKLQLAIVGVRFFGIARGVFRYLERYVSHQTTFRLLARLRVWFYEGIEPLAPAGLQQAHSGDLFTRVVADVDTLENFFLRVIAPPAVAVLTGITMWLFFAQYDIRLALALTGFLLLAGIGVPLLVRRLSQAAGQAMIATRAELNITLVDGIQGLTDLIAYGQQDRQAQRVQRLSRQLTRQQQRIVIIGGLQTALTSLIIILTVITILVIAIPLVRTDRLDGVMLAVLALAAITSFEAIQPLPQALQHLDSNLTAARRLFEMVDRAPHSRPHSQPLSTLGEAIQPPPYAMGREFREGDILSVTDLRFRYHPDDPPALDGISFTLRTGSTLAIVGASGAGKSSLVNVLLRFWDYQEGQIILGGHDLRRYAPDEARAFFGVVTQNTYLFNATVRENLRLARPDATEDDLIRAAQLAHIHDFILSLPQGYDTWVGEQGLKLSGGERQRLAIARAVLKDTPILILDEATANLDTITEQSVMHALASLMEGRSTLLITHRLIGLDTVDEILVLRSGRVVERGYHTDLLQADGHYRRLWEAQNEVFAL